MRGATAMAAAVMMMGAAARAQSFDSQLLRGAREILAQVPKGLGDRKKAPPPAEAPKPVFARLISCGPAPEKAGLPKSLQFYPRLEGLRSLADLPEAGKDPKELWNGESPKEDETASQLNPLRSASATRAKFFYGTWACDTTEYYFTFDMENLVQRAPGEDYRIITGRIRIETRSQVDFEGEFSCTAHFR